MADPAAGNRKCPETRKADQHRRCQTCTLFKVFLLENRSIARQAELLMFAKLANICGLQSVPTMVLNVNSVFTQRAVVRNKWFVSWNGLVAMES